jgi:hypothetical protein
MMGEVVFKSCSFKSRQKRPIWRRAGHADETPDAPENQSLTIPWQKHTVQDIPSDRGPAQCISERGPSVAVRAPSARLEHIPQKVSRKGFS